MLAMAKEAAASAWNATSELKPHPIHLDETDAARSSSPVPVAHLQSDSVRINHVDELIEKAATFRQMGLRAAPHPEGKVWLEQANKRLASSKSEYEHPTDIFRSVVRRIRKDTSVDSEIRSKREDAQAALDEANRQFVKAENIQAEVSAFQKRLIEEARQEDPSAAPSLDHHALRGLYAELLPSIAALSKISITADARELAIGKPPTPWHARWSEITAEAPMHGCASKIITGARARRELPQCCRPRPSYQEDRPWSSWRNAFVRPESASCGRPV